MSRSAILIVLAGLALWGAPPARAAEGTDRATLDGYATWAEGVLQALPEGVRLLEALAQELTDLAAEQRREAGADLAPLEVDPDLLPAARAHALDMLERGYEDHVTPDGLEPGDRVAVLHRRLVGSVGENIAGLEGLTAEQLEGQIGPLAAEIMHGWMQSPGHRENIVDPGYTHGAIAAAAQGETVVVVQLFERRRALLAEPLPLRVGQDETLALDFEQGQGLAVPDRYAYARPDQPAQELVTLELSNDEVPVEPGAYLLKFLFPSGQAGRYEVTNGPALLVR